ncbi:MAG: histidine triad nucleotide-binding protein [Nitrospiria bacterium]
MDNCLFCKMIRKELSTRVVYEDEKALAFYDVNPQAPVHILIIPKAHKESLLDFQEKEDGPLLAHLYSVILNIAKEKELDQKGFRLVVNTGKNGGQTVFHLHFHLLGGRFMTWPPG